MNVTLITGETHQHHHPRIFDSPDHSVKLDALELLADGVKDADLAAPPVVLPDFHHKHNMEMPSSIAVATRGSIRPTLTSSAVNCGMALIAFDVERPPDEAVGEFYRQVREAHPYPAGWRPTLSFDEVLRCCFEGAEFAADRWQVDSEDLNRIEEGGRLDLEPYGGIGRARKELPWMLVQLGRIRFGSIGPSTHFVELQEVEEVLDDSAAQELGLHAGQMALQYHNGGGVLTGTLGALFGSRISESRLLRMLMAVQKPLYHFGSAHSVEELRLRSKLYFSGGCPAVALDSPEGERIMLSNLLAMNYGFAFRQATYASLRQISRRVFGARSKLIVDSPHNAIYKEEIEGGPALVHRHNTSRALPASRMRGHPAFARTGSPVLVPGTNRTCSYLCIPGDGAAMALYSACHGTGSIISDFEHRGLSGPDPWGHTTLRFDYSSVAPEVVPHLDNRGLDEGLGILTRHDIVRPVARLRPFAVLN